MITDCVHADGHVPDLQSAFHNFITFEPIALILFGHHIPHAISPKPSDMEPNKYQHNLLTLMKHKLHITLTCMIMRY